MTLFIPKNRDLTHYYELGFVPTKVTKITFWDNSIRGLDMRVINFYLGETFLGKGLVVIGFTDGRDEVIEAYLQNRMATFFKKRVYGSRHTITDVWTEESVQAEFIQCDEWDKYINTHEAEETILLNK